MKKTQTKNPVVLRQQKIREQQLAEQKYYLEQIEGAVYLARRTHGVSGNGAMKQKFVLADDLRDPNSIGTDSGIVTQEVSLLSFEDGDYND